MRRSASVLLIALLLAAARTSDAQASPLWAIGGDAAIGTELGARARVFRLPDHLLVVERDAPFLKLVTADGRVRQQIGRLGGGPGEFRQPTAAYFDSARREVLVVDGAAVRVSVFAVGDSLRYLRSLTSPEPSLEGICRLRGRLFGLVRNAPTMLREFRIDSDRLIVLRSFAEPKTLHPLASVPALRNEASGSLHCDERQGELVVISRTLGEVHRIDPEGRRHTVHPLPGFAVMSMVASGGAFAAEIRQGDIFDVVANVVPRADGLGVVVARGMQTPQGRRIIGYLTYSLAARPPANAPPVEAWGQVAVVRGGVVCVQEEPIPTLAMFAADRCPSRSVAVASTRRHPAAGRPPVRRGTTPTPAPTPRATASQNIASPAAMYHPAPNIQKPPSTPPPRPPTTCAIGGRRISDSVSRTASVQARAGRSSSSARKRPVDTISSEFLRNWLRESAGNEPNHPGPGRSL